MPAINVPIKCSLLAHNKSKHVGVKYPCDQCDYKATRKHSLLTHIKSIHKGVKYPCDQCDYKATYKNHLLKHIKSRHEGVKYNCDQCDYKATFKHNLLSHFKSYSTSLYICSFTKICQIWSKVLFFTNYSFWATCGFFLLKTNYRWKFI